MGWRDDIGECSCVRSTWLVEPSSIDPAGWWEADVTISTSSALRSSLVMACAEASRAGGMWSSVMTWVGMCSSVCSLCNVEICTGSCTLRSKISLEAGECSLGELERIFEGDAATAAIEEGYGCRGIADGTVCGCDGCILGTAAVLPGEGDRAGDCCPEVLNVEPVVLFFSIFFLPKPKKRRLPVLGSLSSAEPSTSSPSREINGVVEPCGVTLGASGGIALAHGDPDAIAIVRLGIRNDCGWSDDLDVDTVTACTMS